MKSALRGAARVALVVLATGGNLAADEAKGTFRYDTTTVKVSDAIAYRQDVNGKVITVVAFTDIKIDRQAVLDALDPWTGVFQQVATGQGNVIVLRLNSPTECGAYAFLSATSHSLSMSDDYPAHAKSTGEGRVAGDCATAAPVKSFEKTYEFKLAYDQPLMAITKATALPAGGGAPGAAFLELAKAIQAKNAKLVLLHVPANEMPSEPSPAWLEGLALNYPKRVVVKEGVAKGDRARLEIAGMNYEDKKVKGTIEMQKVQGNWRVTGMAMFFSE